MARTPTITREEPESDAPPSARRVDVVDVSAPTNAVVTLRRELARLSQQAMAVERSMEDQGRTRKDALDRLDRATQRALTLEVRLATTEAEVKSTRRLYDNALEDLKKTRDERDELAVFIRAAKAASEELTRSRAETERLKLAHEEATKLSVTLEAELGELRRRKLEEALRTTDKDTELGTLREHIERAEASAVQARESAEKAKLDATSARQEAAEAREASARARDDLASTRDETARERADAAARIERLTKDLDDARVVHADELETLRKELAEIREAESQARTALTHTTGQLEATRIDRDASDERANRLDAELSSARATEAELRRLLEEALAAGSQVGARAEAAEKAHALLVHGMKELYEEVVAGFARNGVPGPPADPPT